MCRWQVIEGDSQVVLKTLEDNSVDSVVCDPPYMIGFMGKAFDKPKDNIAGSVELWREVLRVVKPGAHLLAFGGTRTSHRMVCAIEDAGWQIRDTLMWIYASGFPKSLDVSKAIDAAAGAEREDLGPNIRLGDARDYAKNPVSEFFHPNKAPTMGRVTAPATEAAKQWSGWGTALKPAHEPIVLARKPLIGTVAQNILEHGTGGLNIDGCRIEGRPRNPEFRNPKSNGIWGKTDNSNLVGYESPLGRWPANVILSYPEDEYVLRSNVTPEQRKELFKWLYENA